MIDLVQHLIDKQRKVIETYLKDNQKIFDEALNTTMPIDRCFERIDDCIHFADVGKKPYTAS